MTEPIDIPCDRPECGARPSEPCKPIASHDGRKEYDQELVMAGYHQIRMWRARGQCYFCRAQLSEDGTCTNVKCPGLL